MSIDGAQSVRSEKRTTKFKNYFKQIPVPLKSYGDFAYNLQKAESYEGSYSKKYQDHIPCSFAYKLVSVDDKFTKPIVVFRGENATFKFIQAILKEYEYCKRVAKKHFKEIWSWVEKKKKKKNDFNHTTRVGFVKNSFKMTIRKLEIIATYLK